MGRVLVVSGERSFHRAHPSHSPRQGSPLIVPTLGCWCLLVTHQKTCLTDGNVRKLTVCSPMIPDGPSLAHRVCPESLITMFFGPMTPRLGGSHTLVSVHFFMLLFDVHFAFSSLEGKPSGMGMQSFMSSISPHSLRECSAALRSPIKRVT